MSFDLSGGPAKVVFEQATFTIVSPGHYVPCSVTGQPILLKDLRYWNVERQEAYIDAAAGLERIQSEKE